MGRLMRFLLCMRVSVFGAACLAALSGCDFLGLQSSKYCQLPLKDEFTISNYDSFQFRHLTLDLTPSFSTHTLSATAEWDIASIHAPTTLRLDIDRLQIDSVYCNGLRSVFSTFSNSPGGQAVGLSVPVSPVVRKVKVFYRTSPESRALKWMDGDTVGQGGKPLLYVRQGFMQACTWFPCPDVPGVRFPYSAFVHTANHLTSVMNAATIGRLNDSSVSTFEMDMPVAPCMVGLAVGDFLKIDVAKHLSVFFRRETKARVGPYLEVVRDAFKYTRLHAMFRSSSDIRLVVLPSALGAGHGLPKWVDAEEGLFTGVDTRPIAANIMESLLQTAMLGHMSGETWRDLWPVEGLAGYYAARLVEEYVDRDFAAMCRYNDYMTAKVRSKGAGFGSGFKSTMLAQMPDNPFFPDPDPKSALFFELAAQRAGVVPFDDFIANFLTHMTAGSISSKGFLTQLKKDLFIKQNGPWRTMDVGGWVFNNGLPDNCPHTLPPEFSAIDRMLDAGSVSPAAAAKWTEPEWVYFTRRAAGDSFGVASNLLSAGMIVASVDDGAGIRNCKSLIRSLQCRSTAKLVKPNGIARKPSFSRARDADDNACSAGYGCE